MSSPEKLQSEQQSHQPVPVLMGLFNFSGDDLRANRAGKLTPRQVELLRDKIDDNWMWLGCLPALVIVICACILVTPTGKEPSALTDGGIIAVGIIVILSTVVGVRASMRNVRSEIERPNIQSVRGQFKVYVFKMNKGGERYRLFVAHTVFDLKTSQYIGLTAYLQHENRFKTFKVYYTEQSRTILSIDRLS